MEKTLELFRTGLIRIHIYFTSTRSSIPSHVLSIPPRKEREPHGLPPPLQTTDIVRRRYSEDDDEHEEEAELLSPWEQQHQGLDSTIGSTSCLISLTSIHSPPSSDDRPTFAGTLHTVDTLDSEERALGRMEEGEAIIGPHNIHYGRPDFAAVFDTMKRRIAHQGTTRSTNTTVVGVFYCGSPGLGRTLGRECARVSSSRVRFDFNEE